MMRRKDDQLWKGILEDLFDDFLRFMHPDAGAIFDFSREIEFLDKELDQLFPPEENEYAPKLVDKLAKVYRKDGGEEWILIRIEVTFAFHMRFDTPEKCRDFYDYPASPLLMMSFLCTDCFVPRSDVSYRAECYF